MWTWTSSRFGCGMATFLLAGLTLIGTITGTLISVDPADAEVDDGSIDFLDVEVRQQVDALLAAVDPVSGDGQDAFVDAFAGLLIVYAGDDVQQAAAIADYARQRAPEHSESFEEAVYLVWPGAESSSARTSTGTDPGNKQKGTPAAAPVAQTYAVTEGPPTEGSVPAANGLAAASAVTGNRTLPQSGRSAWGQAGSFGPAAVPAISTARVPNLQTASPIWP